MTGPMQRRDGQSGFTIIELLIALLLSSLILGSAFKLLIENQRAYHGQSQVSEMRQNARSAMEGMTRDLVPAGYGIVRSDSFSLPAVIANEPTVLGTASSTAITVRYNALDVSTTLTAIALQTGGVLTVASNTAFAAGQRCVISDAIGNWDWTTVSSIAAGKILHSNLALSAAYDPDNSTVVATIREISYKYDAAKLQLLRQEDGGSWNPIAENIDTFQIRYWDKDGIELFPATVVDRSRIRNIAISLSARTAETDRTSGKRKTYVLATELMLPNLKGTKDAS